MISPAARVTALVSALVLSLGTATLADSVTAAQAPAAASTASLSPRARIGTLDWLVITTYALGMIGIGWYFSRRNASSEDYLLGGRRMQPWAVGLSLFATLISTISYLSVPGEMIGYGPMLLAQILAYPVVVVVVGWFIIPYFMRQRVSTAYEILESRFGGSVRTLGAVMFLALRLAWMAVIVYATTTHVLVPLTALKPQHAPLVAALMAIVTVAYTAMGGIKAVVWTDVAQTFILFAGAVLSLLVITIDRGGPAGWWPNQWPLHWSSVRLGFQTDARISLGWIALSAFCWYVCTAGSDQVAIQRYLSTRDAAAARRAFITSMVADATVLVFLSALGIALLGYVAAHPELLAEGHGIVAQADQVFPRFIALALPAGVTGLVVSGLLAAAMSSLSAGLSAVCSVISSDFLDRWTGRSTSGAAALRRERLLSIAVGAAVVALSLMVGAIRGNLLEVAFKAANLLVAPLFILFFLAVFVPWATTLGVWLAAAASLITAVLIAYWPAFMPLQPGPSFTWMMPLSLGAGIVVGCLGSLLRWSAVNRDVLTESRSA